MHTDNNKFKMCLQLFITYKAKAHYYNNIDYYLLVLQITDT